MATYYLCYICGRGTRANRARQCNYCGKYVCREHRINGLCPAHVNSISREHADALRIQDDINHWVGRITIPILLFSFIFSFLIIYKSTRWYGFASLGIFLITLMILIAVGRTARKKAEVILRKAIHSKVSDIETTLCIKCIKPLPEGTNKCPTCGNKVTIVAGDPFKDGQAMLARSEQLNKPIPPPPLSSTSLSYTQTTYTPPPPPPPSETQKQYKTPPPPPGYQQQTTQSTPPPPPKYPPLQKTGNQDMDSLLDEIVSENPGSTVEVTSFYDEASNSGFHICKNCHQRFATTGTTKRCPHCQQPLYETR